MFGLFRSTPSISAEDLVKKVEDGAVIIDVRTPQEFAQQRLKGAVNIPVQVISGQIDEIKQLDKTVILYCLSGARAGTAENMLKRSGIDAINIGGIGSWLSVLG